MKKIVYWLLVVCSIESAAQQTLNELRSVALNPVRLNNLAGNRDVIWSADFSSGIQSDWTNSDQSGIAQWEYRGPSTDPNMEVGTRGSCIPVGTTGDPIASPTWENGFVIFDSNWWDNPNNPCSPDNFGTGPAPGPHLATLTTPSIDLSAHPDVALVFNQYLKMYQGQTRIEVSSNGGPWFVAYTNPSIPNPTSTDAQQYVQISTLAGGQSDVKIRFVFDGLYYFWMIDDLTIVDTYTNDLAMRNSTYGDFDLFDLSHPTGYEFLEYSKYPDEMAPLLKFSTYCDNLGGSMQTDCRLHVNILNEQNSVIHSTETSEGFTIPSGSGMELRAGNYQLPTTFGQYRMAFETTQAQSDDFSENNRDTLMTIINDVQYARDRYFTSAVFLGPPEFGNSQYEIGNVFLITNSGLECHSISVAVGIGSSTPATMYGAIYSYDFSALNPATLIATTPSIEIEPGMFNSYGDQILTNLTFDVPVTMEEGVSYFVAVGSEQGPEFFVCALSGDALEFTALVKYFPNNWYSVDRIPIVRMNFGPFDGVAQRTESLAINVYPVPAKNVLQIPTSDWLNESCELKIVDGQGKIVHTELIQTNQLNVTEINIENLSSGKYDLLIYSEKRRGHAQFIKQ